MFRHVFFSAPHRLMFAGGAVQLLAAMILWGWLLAGRYFGVPVMGLPWPPAWVHAGLMVFGVFPWFIFGFLMTALPKWMGAGPLAFRQYVPPFLLLAVGALGLLGYAKALAGLDAAWFRGAIEAGLWGCLAPVFFIVLHRMLPFFTGAVVRPYQPYAPLWALWLMLAALVGHGVLAGAEAIAWRWVLDVVAAAVAVHLSSRWGLRAALRVPMVAMLHLGALWLGAAMALFALQGLLAAFGIAWGGLMPLHALGIGFFASILVGMSTRVTLGHSGRPIGEDRLAWKLFRGLQVVVALRLAGEFAGTLNVFAALGWLVVFGLWAGHYFPMYLRPWPDGQPG
ncbi:MAG TPA: NnrS family protein [Rhodocyclaceae bacterium]|nr:NnrS family protein [Rhodocyclaceae bacterium]